MPAITLNTFPRYTSDFESIHTFCILSSECLAAQEIRPTHILTWEESKKYTLAQHLMTRIFASPPKAHAYTFWEWYNTHASWYTYVEPKRPLIAGYLCTQQERDSHVLTHTSSYVRKSVSAMLCIKTVVRRKFR